MLGACMMPAMGYEEPPKNVEIKAPKMATQDALPTVALGAARAPRVSLDKIVGHSSNVPAAMARYRCRDLAQDYEVLQNDVLGEGCSGKVFVARHRGNGRKYALKRIQKDQVSSKVMQQLIAEVEIFLTLDHPHVAHLHDVYDTESELALLTECLEGGELYARLAQLKIFPEALAAETTREMLRAIGYLHSHGIVHRDLKLENFLYASKDADAPLKIIDFGFAKFWVPNQLMRAACGSISYVSPDVLRGKGYTSQCDLWSLGVIVFMLLAGYPPFHGSDDRMQREILAGNVDWQHTKRWSRVSQEAIDFVKALLTRDPAKRLDAQGALNHRWLLSAAEAPRGPVLSASILRSIGNYAASRPLRRAAMQLLALELAPGDVADLRSTFLELAGDDEGTVKFSEIKAAIRGAEGAEKDAKTPSRKLRRATTEKLKEVFQVMDTNGDDQIYYSDFLAATMNESLKLREDHIRAAFCRLDADNSGSISASDMKAALGDTFEGLDTQLLMRDVALSPSAKGEIGFESFVQVLREEDNAETRGDRICIC